MQAHRTVSREEWLAARKAHLAREKELTRLHDEVAAERRALPWVKVDKDYRFDTPSGQVALADLFEGRSQLVVYHFMLTPGSDHICEGCAFVSDHVDAARQHFEHNDLSFVAISRVPLSRIKAVRKRMGWKFSWVSSAGGSFNFDYGVSFTREQVASGNVGYNYGTSSLVHDDLHGLSVFYRDGDEVFHSYSTYARGVDVLLGAHNYLDLTPKGRNEKGTMDWVRLHDEYEDRPAAQACCA
ncbi:DUF899 family protein [Mesorhizobium sp. CGMCC 1.15528]|uniref:DUF899 family protein n=1 Tax=Mesorhizobium zhangyense TaxID=1776730 RepID=A0A7C9R966_9HYPH|nr:thioredoxin family protein [Mesorhizobium zhangyense]NGN43177.1 DUF899 family protein [Mesorhizobium zhangyense]